MSAAYSWSKSHISIGPCPNQGGLTSIPAVDDGNVVWGGPRGRLTLYGGGSCRRWNRRRGLPLNHGRQAGDFSQQHVHDCRVVREQGLFSGNQAEPGFQILEKGVVSDSGREYLCSAACWGLWAEARRSRIPAAAGKPGLHRTALSQGGQLRLGQSQLPAQDLFVVLPDERRAPGYPPG